MTGDESPPRPESDDPFLLLELDEKTATALSCKRAWTRLIRRYRPDRSPASFLRVRAAYEEALRRVAARDAREGLRHEASSSDERARPDTGEASTPHGLARAGEGPRTRRALQDRIDALLLQGRVSDLLLEIDKETLFEQAAGDALLARSLVRVACAATWRHPDEADALLDRMVRSGIGDLDLEDGWEARRGVRMAWLSWRRDFGSLPNLTRFIEIGPALSRPALGAAARAVAVEARRHPSEMMDALEELGEGDPDLLVHLWEMVGEAAAVGEVPRRESRITRRRRQAPQLWAALDDADKALRRTWSGRVNGKPGLVVGTLTLVILGRAGAWAFFIMVALLFAFLAGVLMNDEPQYRQVVRPRLVAVVARTGCRAVDLLAALRAMGKPPEQVARFKDRIKADAGLELLAAIVEVGLPSAPHKSE